MYTCVCVCVSMCVCVCARARCVRTLALECPRENHIYVHSCECMYTLQAEHITYGCACLCDCACKPGGAQWCSYTMAWK